MTHIEQAMAAVDSLESTRWNPTRADSVRWLIGRIPEEWAVPMSVGKSPLGFPMLTWHASIGSRCSVYFVTPHHVGWTSEDHPLKRGGEFNLAMNLQEILDMIRETLEGK